MTGSQASYIPCTEFLQIESLGGLDVTVEEYTDANNKLNAISIDASVEDQGTRGRFKDKDCFSSSFFACTCVLGLSFSRASIRYVRP